MQHFDLGAVISSLMKTPPFPLTSVNTTNVTCTPALSVVGEGEKEEGGGGVRCDDTTSIGSCSTKKRTNGLAVHEPMAMQTAIARQNRRGIWLCKQPLRRHISDLPYHRQPYETAAQDWLPAEALLDLFYFLVI